MICLAVVVGQEMMYRVLETTLWLVVSMLYDSHSKEDRLSVAYCEETQTWVFSVTLFGLCRTLDLS